MKNTRPFAPIARARQSAFTLIEVLVVISIIIILLAVSIPTIRALTKGNSQSQAVNLARTYIAQARSMAVATHNLAGVVFYEQTSKFTSEPHLGQTAVQMFIADPNQTQYNPKPPNTVFIRSGGPAYMPSGIMVFALNDDPSKPFHTAETSAGLTRAIVFDAQGQLVTRNGLARPDLGAAKPDSYPYRYGDWKFTTKRGAPSDGVSSGALSIVDMELYRAQNFANDIDRGDWIQKHADVLVINAYTGAPIQ